MFDASGIVTEVADHFYGNPDYSNLPRKHKYTISACPDRCNMPEINCVALVGSIHEGREGFAVKRRRRPLLGAPHRRATRRVRAEGGGGRDPRACTDVWSEDLNYRVSRVKARLKFMVDDIGADGMRERVEEQLGRTLEDYTLPTGPERAADHIGVHRQRQDG